MQLLLAEIHAALPATVAVHRASPIVSVADNYDRLGYPADGAARDARYTRYVCEGALLRTQTSAMIPLLLRELAAAPPDDVVLSCPGLVYRRDVIDRLHVGEPHQVDLWRIARVPLGEPALDAMIAAVVAAPRDAELLGDQVRTALGDGAELVEAVEVLSATPHHELPAAAVTRLGIGPGQWNLLVRVTLRALDRTLTHDECNTLRDEIYAAVHEGAVHHWANRHSGSCTSAPSGSASPHSSRRPR